jgi:SNF2 family DNA or RNA helicase
LNITAASHVIHFNLEWNPAVEDQASARAYRLGQTKIVTIHRLFYIDTVEDVINDRLTRKRELASTAVIGTDGSDADMQDILKALRVSPLNQGRRHNDGSNGNRESAQCQ